MRKPFFWAIFLILNGNAVMAEEVNCKNLKLCAEWATAKTGARYNLGKFEKRSLTIEKGLDLSEGDPDTIFSFILNQNEFTRIKRDDGSYEVIALRDLKLYHFPSVKLDDWQPNLDYYSFEINLKNKERVKNAMLILKKYISKNGKVLEVTDSSKIMLIDTGIQLVMLKDLIYLLDHDSAKLNLDPTREH